MNGTAAALCREREKRVLAAIALEVPDRVPLVCNFGFFPARYKGLTFQQAMYDRERTMQAWVATMAEFQPDMYENPFGIRFLGRILEALDFRQLRWPGHGCHPMASYQYVEGEYLRAEEYPQFLGDLTDFMIRTYWPRVFGALEGFRDLPPPSAIISYYMGLLHFGAFDTPEIERAFAAIQQAGRAAREIVDAIRAYDAAMKEIGIPPQFGALCQAPFDTLSDFFRGTKGAMLDMFRHPEELLAASGKLLPMMLEMGRGARKRGIPRVFIPLHKGLDGFMSPEQFRRFFWPSLRELVVGLVAEGLTPFLLWEGDCTSRLETIADVPAGKVVYWFERTDIFRAKEVLGARVCLRGNVPLALMCTGTPDDVRGYCKRLIDVAGKDGGFIMDCATVLDDARAENVHALFEFTRDYGIYR